MSMNQPHGPRVTPHTTAFLQSIALGAQGGTLDGPVTVAELLLALASYPQDATVDIYADTVMGGESLEVEVGDRRFVVYEGIVIGRPQHYEPPVVEEVEAPAPRRHAGDDYAAAQDVLEWMESQGMSVDELGRPITSADRGRVARDFAARDRRTS